MDFKKIFKLFANIVLANFHFLLKIKYLYI
jgi:hypothetical protein